MPVLKIINQGTDEVAEVEHKAQVNKIEDIQVDGISLTIEDKKINIPLATEEEIATLFNKEVN